MMLVKRSRVLALASALVLLSQLGLLASTA